MLSFYFILDFVKKIIQYDANDYFLREFGHYLTTWTRNQTMEINPNASTRSEAAGPSVILGYTTINVNTMCVRPIGLTYDDVHNWSFMKCKPTNNYGLLVDAAHIHIDYLQPNQL